MKILRYLLECVLLGLAMVVLMPALLLVFVAAIIRRGRMRSSPPPAEVRVLGWPLWNTTLDEAVARVMQIRRDREGPKKIFFLNTDCFNIAQRSEDYRQSLAGADVLLGDGIGVKIAGFVTDQKVRENVNGTDLFPKLCAALEHEEHDDPRGIYLLGARPGVAQAVADWIRANHPCAKVAGYRDGYFDPEDSPNVAREIRESGAAVLLVAQGVPRQERWITENVEATGVDVAMGVGGLFDFYGDRIPRAPRWVRRLGFEWLYRLFREPRRMARRYLIGNGLFLLRVFRYGKSDPLARREGDGSTAPSPGPQPEPLKPLRRQRTM